MEDYLKKRLDLVENMMPILQAYAKRTGTNVSQVIGQMFSGQFPITQRFGNVNPLYKGVTAGSRHTGLDIGTPYGTQLYSPVSGQARTGYDPSGFGQYVQVFDPGSQRTYQFSHLSNFAKNLQGNVTAGQSIGYTGGTGARKGRSTGAHLDLAVKEKGKYIDPLSIEALNRMYSNGQ